MSPKQCSLAYDIEEYNLELAHDGLEQIHSTSGSVAEFVSLSDVIEFGGTLTISF